MTLSLMIGGTHKPLGSKEKKEGDRIKLGSFVDCKVTKVDDSGLGVVVTKDDKDIEAFIPKQHLTDCPAMADQLLATYKPKDEIKGALCFERDVVPILSLKRSLLRVAKERASLPSSFDDLQVRETNANTNDG